MALTTIQLQYETKELLSQIKTKYKLGTYDICVNSMAVFFLNNEINPKENFAGGIRTALVNMEGRIGSELGEIVKKLTKDNLSLRKWVGAVTKEHLVPMTEKLSILDKIVDLGINNIKDKNIENSKYENPLNSHIVEESNKSIDKEKSLEELETMKEKYRELYHKFDAQKQVLFKIFNNAKIEKGGIMSASRIVLEIEEDEWEIMKKKF